MKRPLFLALLSLLSCGGDGPSSPRVPDVRGLWTGTVTLESVTPFGYCLADGARANLPFTLSATLSLDQSGGALQGVLTFTSGVGGAAAVAGEVEGDDIVLRATSGLACAPAQCPGGPPLRVCVQSITLSGNVQGGSMAGAYGETSQVRIDVRGGPVDATLVFGGRFSFRQ